MSDYQILSDLTPLADAGSVLALTPNQDLNPADGTNLLQLEGLNTVHLVVEGPRLQLTPADIAGVYPAPGSEESPDEFLPHIALERRTLPWERKGPNGPKPWLALMLLKESEMRDGPARTAHSPGSTLESVTLSQVAARDPEGYLQLRTVLGLADNTQLSVIYLRNSALPSRGPRKEDLRYLCHLRRDLKTGKDRSIVVSYRLPDAGPPGSAPEIHTAFLVSLESRGDLFFPSRNGINASKEAVFVVLHHWSFTPSKGGDFEQVIRSIAIRPNGGVLRFGNLPADAPPGRAPLSGGFKGVLRPDGFYLDPLPHLQPHDVVWRGPLRPFTTPLRSQGFAIRAAPEEFENPQPGDPLDYSHASAFELGRLLALARPEVLEDLRAVHWKAPQLTEVAVNKLPPALQKPDWVVNVNPEWTEQPWSMPVNGQLESIVKTESEFLQNGVGDVGGIAQQAGGWLEEVLVDLAGMSTPAATPVAQIDIQNATPQSQANTFADVQTLGTS